MICKSIYFHKKNKKINDKIFDYRHLANYFVIHTRFPSIKY